MDLNSSSQQVTVVIVTKNRREELHTAVRSALDQDIQPKVLVVDDGSSDGTGEMIARDFPQVQFQRFATSAGLITRRNDAAHLTDTPFIVSIDDDAVFSTPSILRRVMALFDDLRIAVVAIPYIDVNTDPKVRQLAPNDVGSYLTYTFRGTAHVLRREVFLKLGGYNEFLFHQGEEEDLSIRLLDKGYVVRLGAGDPIHHFESPKRDFRRMDTYTRRNQVLFAHFRVPMPHALLHLIRVTRRGILEAIRTKRVVNMCRGLLLGYVNILRHPELRNPVSRQTYKFWMLLRKRQAIDFETVESQFLTFVKPAKGLVPVASTDAVVPRG